MVSLLTCTVQCTICFFKSKSKRPMQGVCFAQPRISVSAGVLHYHSTCTRSTALPGVGRGLSTGNLQDTPTNMQGPPANIQDPLTNPQDPPTNLRGPLANLCGTLTNLRGLPTKLRGPSTNLCGLQTNWYGPPTSSHGPPTSSHGVPTNSRGLSTNSHGPPTNLQVPPTTKSPLLRIIPRRSCLMCASRFEGVRKLELKLLRTKRS